MSNIKLEAEIGENITSFAERLIEASVVARAEGTFNGATTYADHGDTTEEVVTRWRETMDANAKAYRESPEGIATAAKQAEHEAAVIEAAHAIVRGLPELNIKDLSVALQLCRSCVDPLGYTYTPKGPSGQVAEALEAAGYVSNVNTGANYNGEDKENSARYLIGQALDGLRGIGSPHPVFEKFHDEWKAKWGVK